MSECTFCDGTGEVPDPLDDEDVVPCPECAGTGEHDGFAAEIDDDPDFDELDDDDEAELDDDDDDEDELDDDDDDEEF